MRSMFILLMLSVTASLFSAPAAEPLNAKPLSLDGMWVGSYEMKRNGETVAIGLSLVIDQQKESAALKGRMVEEFTIGRGLWTAKVAEVAGILGDDGVLRCEKRYLADDVGHALVSFELHLSENGDVLSGYWRMGDNPDKTGMCVLARMTAADRRQFIQYKRDVEDQNVE